MKKEKKKKNDCQVLLIYQKRSFINTSEICIFYIILINSSSYHRNSNLFKQQFRSSMEKEQSLAQKILQSQQEFKNQFDPNHPSYHSGDKTVVPIGGDRVPESMPTMYAEGYVPPQQQETVDYGQEYKRVENDRNIYQNLKKDLAKLGPIVQAFLRHEEIFKQNGYPTNQKHLKTHQENIAKQKGNLQEVQNVLNNYIPLLQAIDGEGKESAKELAEIIFQSGKQYANKQALANFNFKCKKLSTKTFSIAQKYLQKLKDIKKEHANKQKKIGQKKQETV